jgi:Spy/CpxP family protein refolding chaperone
MTASLKAKLIAGFVLAFVAGGATGAFFSFHQARHWREDFGRHSHFLTERMQHQFEAQLHLTPDQIAKVSPIFDQAANELQQIRAESGAKVRQVFRQTHEALQPILTDEQRARLQEIDEHGHGGHGHQRRLHHRGVNPSPNDPQNEESR